MSYPVGLAIDYAPENRSRLTTFFRGAMVIPHYVVLSFYGIAFFFAVLVAWFALLFTGRWPEGLYNFSAGFMRYSARVSAYYLLATDTYPPFSGGEEPDYPVRVTIPPPLESYSRLKVFFRGIYVIPAEIVLYFLSLLGMLAAFASWFVILFTGRHPEGLFKAIRQSLTYSVRANALIYLMTETYPPLSED